MAAIRRRTDLRKIANANTPMSITPARKNAIGPVIRRATGLQSTAGSYRLAAWHRPRPVKTSVTELPESRVRVDAEVPPEEVERRLQQAARQLGREMRIPGFRKGKVPPPVVIRRLGREAVLDEALRSSLGSWYVDAIDRSGIVPVGEPELDVGDLPAEGQPLTFSVEIGVRPRATLGDYKGLEVGRREPHVEDAAIDAELERLRDRFATLETVERAAAEGDHVVIDYLGSIDGEPFDGGEGRDQLLELGSGRLIPGFEEQLVGAGAGDERTVEVTFPEDYPGDLGGKHGALRGHRQGGQGQAAARARRRVRVRVGGLRHARRAARGHRQSPEGGRRARDRARVRGGGARRRRRRGAGRRAREARSRARTRAARADAVLARSGAGSRRRRTCRSPARTRRRSRTRPSPRPTRRCAARRCSRRSSTPSRSSRARRTSARRSSRAPSARARRSTSCSSSCARTGVWTASARTSPPARRSSCSCARRSRSASSRRRRGEKLWTPGKEDSDPPAEGPGRLWTPGT